MASSVWSSSKLFPTVFLSRTTSLFRDFRRPSLVAPGLCTPPAIVSLAFLQLGVFESATAIHGAGLAHLCRQHPLSLLDITARGLPYAVATWRLVLCTPMSG